MTNSCHTKPKREQKLSKIGFLRLIGHSHFVKMGKTVMEKDYGFCCLLSFLIFKISTLIHRRLFLEHFDKCNGTQIINLLSIKKVGQEFQLVVCSPVDQRLIQFFTKMHQVDLKWTFQNSSIKIIIFTMLCRFLTIFRTLKYCSCRHDYNSEWTEHCP